MNKHLEKARELWNEYVELSGGGMGIGKIKLTVGFMKGEYEKAVKEVKEMEPAWEQYQELLHKTSALEEQLERRDKERERIKGIVKEIKLTSKSWEADEDIICYNGRPIGGTVSRKRYEFDRWLESFKEELSNQIDEVQK